MSALKDLSQTISGFLDLAPDAVNRDTPLNGRLNHSIGRAALDAAVRRRFGISCRAVYSAATYGELEAAIAHSIGAEAPTHAAVELNATAEEQLPQPDASSIPSGKCGIDLELIENLPAADDYWQADFYKQNFTPNEIAYCSRRDDPRQHFAARWCAKEALKKCAPAFLSQPMSALEVASKPDGAPQLFLIAASSRRLLPYAVSFSHTSFAAVAMVCGVQLDAAPDKKSPHPESVNAASAMPPRRGRKFDVFLAILSTVALAIACWSAMHFI